MVTSFKFQIWLERVQQIKFEIKRIWEDGEGVLALGEAITLRSYNKLWERSNMPSPIEFNWNELDRSYMEMINGIVDVMEEQILLWDWKDGRLIDAFCELLSYLKNIENFVC